MPADATHAVRPRMNFRVKYLLPVGAFLLYQGSSVAMLFGGERLDTGQGAIFTMQVVTAFLSAAGLFVATLCLIIWVHLMIMARLPNQSAD